MTRMTWLTLGLLLLPPAAGAAECKESDQWYLPGITARSAGDEWLTRVTAKSVILIGEHHDNASHHRWQRQVLERLVANRTPTRPIVVGFEMIPRSRQAALSAWASSRQDPDRLRRDLAWDSLWGFDFAYYSPLLVLARQQATALLALNADEDLVSSVRQQGWEQTPAELRQGLQAPTPPSKDYLRTLASSFLAHPPPAGGESAAERKQRFLRFVQGQQVWDSVMAQTIARALAQHPGAQVIAFMGSWHMIARGGVAHQLQQSGVNDVGILVPWDSHLDCALLDDNFADAVYGVDYR